MIDNFGGQYLSRFSGRNLKVKVTNTETNRIDVHNYISREEADWLSLSPNLRVEILEVSVRGFNLH